MLIIFDFDGVVVDSEIIANAVNADALTSIGYPIDLETTIKKFVGVNRQSMRQMIFDESGIQLSDDFFELALQEIRSLFKTALDPLIPSLLNELASDQSIKKCIASSNTPEQIICSLEITQQSSFFEKDSIFTSSLVERGKPFPDLFLFAAQKMGVAPENCIVVEDSLPGITAAKAAGMKVIGFLGGTHAQFPWYSDQIESTGIPIAASEEELLERLKDFQVHSLAKAS